MINPKEQGQYQDMQEQSNTSHDFSQESTDSFSNLLEDNYFFEESHEKRPEILSSGLRSVNNEKPGVAGVILHESKYFTSEKIPVRESKNPEPIGPGPEKVEVSPTIAPGKFSTRTKNLSTVEKQKAELDTRLSKDNAADNSYDESCPPIISDPQTESSENDLISARSTMSNGFIKLKKEAFEFLITDPDAFLLLTLIALRALRVKSKYAKKGISIGQALVGDYKKIGLTEQRYRDAKHRIEHIYHFATFKGTNKGTIATLIGTDIYDINRNSKERAEERTNNGQRTDKERLKKKIRSKEEEKDPHIPLKIAFRENVQLTQTEHDKALADFGQELLNAMLDELDAYKARSGKVYKSDYACFRTNSWVFKNAKQHIEELSKTNLSAPTKRSTPAPQQDKISSIHTSRLQGKYVYKSEFGSIELFSSQGYSVAKFATSDVDGFNNWLAERNL